MREKNRGRKKEECEKENPWKKKEREKDLKGSTHAVYYPVDRNFFFKERNQRERE